MKQTIRVLSGDRSAGGDPPRDRAVQRRLRKLIQGDIRWVRPEGIHLTLKFFGDIFASDVANIAAVAEKAAAAERPFSSCDRRRGGLPRSAPAPGPLAGDERRRGEAGGLSKGAGAGAPGDRFPPRGAALPAASHPGDGSRRPKGLIGLVEALEKGEKYTAGRFVASGLEPVAKRSDAPGARSTQDSQGSPLRGRNRR